MNFLPSIPRRSTPPFMIGAALLFWGYEVDWLLIAAPMAAAVEAARWLGAKWDFSDKDLNRIWDLCMVLMLGALIVQFTAIDSRDGARYQFFQWFPLIFLPLILGQAYGNRERFPKSAFSWSARKNQPATGDKAQTIDVGYAYFAVCLISAGAANKREGEWFFIGVCLLTAWAFWATSPKRFPAWVWASSFLALVLVAFGGQLGLLELQRYAESTIPNWFGQYLRRNDSGAESTTGLGQIGRIKASSEIIMRVQPDSGFATTLLRLASFTDLRIYPGEAWIWSARGNTSYGRILPEETDGTIWKIPDTGDWNEALTIYQSLPKRRTLLTLPKGTVQIHDLPVRLVERNGLGAVRVSDAPGFVAYQALFENRHPTVMRPMLPLDLSIPASETNLIQDIAAGLSLSTIEPSERPQAIAAFFERDFSFSLFVPENGYRQRYDSPLRHFLTETHSGHCEYFATATVLLLRNAGIPARYVTGYSLQERDSSGLFIVRERHAHSWAEYWMDGQWHDLDTTPGVWNQAESLHPSRFQRLLDWKSNLVFRFQKWRWLGDESWLERFAPLILAPPALWLLWTIFIRSRRPGLGSAGQLNGHLLRPGDDSEFYWIERHLTAATANRPNGVTLSRWLDARLQNRNEEEQLELLSLLRLHYRYRFDPAGLKPEERLQLRERATRWLARSISAHSRSATKGLLRG